MPLAPYDSVDRKTDRAAGRRAWKTPRWLAPVGRSVPRALIWTGGTLLALLLLLFVASFFVDEPMRRSMERRMNQSLKGYSVQLPGLHFQLIGLSVTLKGLTVRQQANPNPPVMYIPHLHASVHWRELFSGHVVADFLFEQPKVYVNLTQFRSERKDPVPVKEKGWQQAFEQIYPLKVNLLRIRDGEITYIDEDPKRPLQITHLSFRANNIRNIHSKDRVYPSPVHAEATVFGSGQAVVDGHANFLAEPYPGVHVNASFQKVPLDYFRPVLARANLVVRKGTLSTDGEIEYAPAIKFVHLNELTVRDLYVDYVHTAPTAPAEAQRKQKVEKAVSKVSNKPGVLLRLDKLTVTGCDVGMVNKAKDPPYRVFLSDATATVTNLSNHFSQGPAVVRLKGRFMGSGPTEADATFRPDNNGPDFDLKGQIENTQMTTMNDLLRAYGKFDVVAGVFSFYTEIHIKNGVISGYVKPLFKDMKVYDKRQDADKSFFRKAYEAIVGGIAKFLENRPRAEVATVADISGRVDSPHSSTWQVIGRLIENAFFHAILPGFDREISTRKS